MKRNDSKKSKSFKMIHFTSICILIKTIIMLLILLLNKSGHYTLNNSDNSIINHVFFRNNGFPNSDITPNNADDVIKYLFFVTNLRMCRYLVHGYISKTTSLWPWVDITNVPTFKFHIWKPKNSLILVNLEWLDCK